MEHAVFEPSLYIKYIAQLLSIIYIILDTDSVEPAIRLRSRQNSVGPLVVVASATWPSLRRDCFYETNEWKICTWHEFVS